VDYPKFKIETWSETIRSGDGTLTKYYCARLKGSCKDRTIQTVNEKLLKANINVLIEWYYSEIGFKKQA